MCGSASSAVSAGSRRFWITVLIFALANLAVWVGYDRLRRTPRQDVLMVEQFLPGVDAVVERRPTVKWKFNLDMAAEPGAIEALRVPGSVQPAVAGVWAWQDARTLTFTPAEPLAKATAYRFEIASEKVRSRDGFVLAQPFAAAVKTEGLKLESVRQIAYDEQDRPVLELMFNDGVLPADVMNHLEIIGPVPPARERGSQPAQGSAEGSGNWNSVGSNGGFGTNSTTAAATQPEGKRLKCSLFGENSGNVVRVQTAPVLFGKESAAKQLTLRLTAGLKGAGGPLGLAEKVEKKVTISGALLATEIEATSQSEGNPEITIRFNNPVNVGKLRDVISTEPDVDFELSEGYSSSVRLIGEFQCGTRYAVKIGKGPEEAKDADKDGDKKGAEGGKGYPRPATLSVFVPDRQAGVWFKHEGGYLGSQGHRTVVAKAVNVSAMVVQVMRVYENNLVAWRNAAQRNTYGGGYAEPYSQAVVTKKIALENVKNKPQELRLDIDELLGAGRAKDGVYAITLLASESSSVPEVPAAENWSGRYWSRFDDSSETLVTLSDIGLTAKQTHEGVVAWAVSLKTAKPLAKVRVRVFSNRGQLLAEGRTGEDGLVRLGPVSPGLGETASVLLADRESDGEAAGPVGLTWLDLRNTWDLSEFATSGRGYLRQGFEAFVYTDRGVYRPGETVVLRSIVRGHDGKTPEAFPVKWQIRRPDGREWKSFTVNLDKDGAAEWKVTLPTDVPTGYWSALLGLAGSGGRGVKVFGSEEFQVEEFMPERMKAALELSGPGLGEGGKGRLALSDKPLLADVQGDYLFGQPTAALPAGLVVRMEPGTFYSQEWSEWQFGDSVGSNDCYLTLPAQARRLEPPGQMLDAKGHARFTLDLGQAREGASEEEGTDGGDADGADSQPADTEPASQPAERLQYRGPWRITAVATVTETGGRAVTTAKTILADEVPYYVGLHPKNSGNARPKEVWEVEVALVTPEGKVGSPGKASLEAKLYRDKWNNSLALENGRYVYHSTRVFEEIPTARPTLKMADGRGTCTLVPPEAGAYVLLVSDRKTGHATALRFYTMGSGGWDDSISRENPERLEVQVLPVKGGNELFRSGDEARVLVRSPFAGQLLLTVETDEVLLTRVVELEKKTAEVTVKVPEGCGPNAYVSAAVVRGIDPTVAWRTHRAYGVAPLQMDPADRKLQVKVQGPAEMRPGTTLDVRVLVKDATGNPVQNAAVALAAVDEGICQLTRFETPDPLAWFWAKRALGVNSYDLYGQLMPEVNKPDRISAVGGGDESMQMRRHSTPVSAKRVKPVALVSDILHTDEEGGATAHLQVPQFIGQLRVMAVSYADRRVGSKAEGVLVRSPVIVQSSLPRFAAPGDRFEVPLVVFNNLAEGGDGKVTVELLDGENGAKNPLAFAEADGRSVSVPLTIARGGQAQTSVALLAGKAVGVAKARIAAEIAGERYEEMVELPVRPAAPMITRGDVVAAEAGKPVELTLPDDMLAGTERLDVRVTPRPNLHLPDGLDYLDRYPYGCAEQTLSGCFPLVYLPDVGAEIAPGLFEKGHVDYKLQVGITRLIGMQTGDGGIAMWQGSRESWPWASVYAAHFLVEAQAAGHAVPEDFRARLLGYVRGLLDKSPDGGGDVEAQAYACYVLALAGKPERAAMNRLAEVIKLREQGGTLDAAGTQGRFFLATAWLAAGRRDLATGMLPQNLPTPRTGRELGGNVGSPVRDQAIMLSTLLAVAPDHGAIPGLVEKLAAAGQAGGWRSTQDTAFAVMALGRYLRATKGETPFETAELLFGEKRVTDTSEGRALVWGTGAMPGRGATVKIGGKAAARGYVAWTLSGVPMKSPADADHGVQVRRAYLDEKGKPLALGSVRSGQLVRVELTVTTTSHLTNFVLEDLLPAGLEVENPRLESGATAAQGAAGEGAMPVRLLGGARLEVRDDRLVVVASASPGTNRYSYLARAVTPGTFVVPPVRGECMYDLGTNSVWGGGQTMTVVGAGKERPVVAEARSEKGMEGK